MAYLQKDADADARYIIEKIFRRREAGVELLERLSEKLLAIANHRQSANGLKAEAEEMQNAFRILFSIDLGELEAGGVCEPEDGRRFWEKFRNNPPEAAIRLDGERFFRLWKIIKSRQPRRRQ